MNALTRTSKDLQREMQRLSTPRPELAALEKAFSEAEHGRYFMGWIEAITAEYATFRAFNGLDLIHHIPNGGARTAAAGAKMKAEGVKAGMPDYFLPVPRAPHHGLYIELKKAGGRTSPEQRAMLLRLRVQGYAVKVCEGYREAALTCCIYMTGHFEDVNLHEL